MFGDGACLSLWGRRRARPARRHHGAVTFSIRLMTPTGGRPLSLHRSTAASYAPTQQYTAVARDQREHMAGPGEINGAGIRLATRAGRRLVSSAEIPVHRRAL